MTYLPPEPPPPTKLLNPTPRNLKLSRRLRRHLPGLYRLRRRSGRRPDPRSLRRRVPAGAPAPSSLRPAGAGKNTD